MSALVILLCSTLLSDSTLLKYRLPDVSVSAFTLTLRQNAHHGSPWWGRGVGLSAVPSYDMLVLGERLNLSTKLQVDVGAIPFSIVRSDTSLPGAQMSSVDVNPTLGLSLNWYPMPFPLGLGADVDVTAYNRWQRRTAAQFEPPAYGHSYARHYLSAVIGIGPCLGRFRDARTVVQALRIFEILRQEKHLRRPADDEDVQALANLLATRPSFSLRLDQPDKYWFADLETLLRNRELISPRMPARTWFLIEDTRANANSIPRPVGVCLSVRPGWRTKWDVSSEVRSDTTVRWRTASESPTFTTSLKSGYPLGRRWQVAESATWQVSRDSGLARHELSAQVGLGYCIFDCLSVSAEYTGWYLNRSVDFSRSRRFESWHHLRHGPALSADYYREDRMRVHARVGFERYRYQRVSPSSNVVREVSFDWGLSLNFRLLPWPW
jgi:hypothetical protein